MPRSLLLYSTLTFGLFAVAGCSSEYTACPTPLERRACSCGGDVEGVQQCMPEKVWSDCDCSGEGTPPADAGMAGASGGGAGGAGGTSGASGAAGAGAGGSGAGGAGGGGAGGTGGSAGSMTPAAGAGAGGAGAGGAAGEGGAGGAGGSMAEARPAYGGCTEDTVDEDCREGSICVLTQAVSGELTVCAPSCTMAEQCPVPDGEYEAMVVCAEGRCRIDCTPEVLAPRSCPSGMACAEQVLDTSYCHDAA